MNQRDRIEWLAVACWATLGAGILVGSWHMDRLGHQGISPWSAPGLLPGAVGALMLVFAAALAAPLLRRPGRTAAPATAAAQGAEPAALGGPSGWRTAGLAALLCLAFAGAALGRGWPFQAEAALFIFAFAATFSGPAWRREGRLARGLASTAVVALVAAVAISALFERVFLVRLP
ncbi:MAG: tripartite tricarboxylate transporter TctB family protein [Rubrivivax sp.]|nr:tripartite tricarboxylate transporter TctB family protein [Rubrivivax sp.]